VILGDARIGDRFQRSLEVVYRLEKSLGQRCLLGLDDPRLLALETVAKCRVVLDERRMSQ
jgi:hypothetical protein